MNGHNERAILGEYANLGFSIQEVDDDCLEVYLKDSRVAVLPPTSTKRIIQQACFDVVWGIRVLFGEAETRLLSFSPLSSSFLEIGGASLGRAGSTTDHGDIKCR